MLCNAGGSGGGGGAAEARAAEAAFAAKGSARSYMPHGSRVAVDPAPEGTVILAMRCEILLQLAMCEGFLAGCHTSPVSLPVAHGHDGLLSTYAALLLAVKTWVFFSVHK